MRRDRSPFSVLLNEGIREDYFRGDRPRPKSFPPARKFSNHHPPRHRKMCTCMSESFIDSSLKIARFSENENTSCLPPRWLCSSVSTYVSARMESSAVISDFTNASTQLFSTLMSICVAASLACPVPVLLSLRDCYQARQPILRQLSFSSRPISWLRIVVCTSTPRQAAGVRGRPAV